MGSVSSASPSVTCSSSSCSQSVRMEIITGDEIWIEDQESGEQSPVMRNKPHIIDNMLETAEKHWEIQSPITARQRLREIVKA